MSSSAIMARLLVLALAGGACLGQQFLDNPQQNVRPQQSSGNYQGDPYGNNGRDNYGNAPQDYTPAGGVGNNGINYGNDAQNGGCPAMSELGVAAKLQVEPWAWFRTVNILATKQLMSDASQGSATGNVPQLEQTATNANTGAQGSSDSTLLADTANYRALGQVRSTISWTPTMALYSPYNGREISRIVNPGFAWDTTQEIYDCRGQLMGKLRYNFNWQNLFTNNYVQHQVENAQGSHIANLFQESLTETYFGSGQHFIYISDLNGNAIASMRRPTGGWQAGVFGEYFECEIEMKTLNAQVPPPALNPDFLSLVLANAMAGEKRLGPYISLIFYPSIIVLLCLCSCFCGIGLDHLKYWLTCCGLCTCFGLLGSNDSNQQYLDSAKGTSQKYLDSAKEEKDALLASGKNATGQGGSTWGCCSRRQVAPH